MSDILRGHKTEEKLLLRVDKSLCLPNLNTLIVLLYDVATVNEIVLLSL